MDEKDITSAIELFKSNILPDEDIRAVLHNIKSKMKIQNFVEFSRSFTFQREASRNQIRNQLSTLIITNKFPYKKAGEYLGHVSLVLRVCFDRSERVVFTGSDDGILKAWDVTTGELIHSFIGHKYCIIDITVSADNMYISSVDMLGLVNIWSLRDFSLAFQISVAQEVDFIEFIDTSDEYDLVVVERRGVIKVIKFNSETIISELDNKTISEIAGEGSVQAICITEGGKFLMSGGMWPFLLIFDLANVQNSILVFETDGYSIIFVTASRRNLKFAAATNFEAIIIWEFNAEKTARWGSFKRKRISGLPGGWRKTIIDLKIEDVHSEQMCFLADDRYLVCLCSDSKIRIYFNNVHHKSFDHFSGNLTAHPIENIFVTSSEKIAICDIEGNILLSEVSQYTIVDVQFSSDGEYLVICDEMGLLSIYAIDPFVKKYSSTPREQFFRSDFTHFNSNYFNNYFIECEKSILYDFNQTPHKVSRLGNYNHRVFRREEKFWILENMGCEHLRDDILTINNFKKKYFVIETKVEDSGSVSTLRSDEVLSLDEALICTESSEYIEDEYESIKRRFSSDDSLNIRRSPSARPRRAAALAPLGAEEVEQARIRREERKAIRDAKRNDSKESKLADSKLADSKLADRTDSKLADRTDSKLVDRTDSKLADKTDKTNKKTRGSEITEGRAKRKESVVSIAESVKYSEDESNEEVRMGPRRKNRKIVKPFSISEELKEIGRAWIMSVNTFRYNPQVNDTVRFIYDRYILFREYAPYNCNYPMSDCELIVTEINYVLQYYVKLTLRNTESNAIFSIEYFDMPFLPQFFILSSNFHFWKKNKFKYGEEYQFEYGNNLINGKFIRKSNDDIRLDSYTVKYYDLYIEQTSIFANKDAILAILERYKRNKLLYTTLRRSGNPEFIEKIDLPLNFNIIQQRVINNFYRTKKAFLEDLDVMKEISHYLQRGYEETVRQINTELTGSLNKKR